METSIPKNLIYAGISMILGGLLVYEKFANDVVPFDSLDSACSDQVEAVSYGYGRRYKHIRLTVPDVGEAVLHRNPSGFTVAAQAILDEENYCFWFDPIGRTNSIYHFTVDGNTVMEYSTIAAKHRFDVNGLFLVGSVLLFGVGPFYLYQQYRGPKKSLW